MTRDEQLRWLKANLKPKRVAHSLGVEATARKLAQRFGCDAEKAAVAGLLHDCAKSLPQELQAAYAREAGFDVDKLSLMSEGVLHAPAGAIVARLELGVTDQDVLSAIFWHNIPSRSMTALDICVSLGDLIEPNRDFDGVEELRRAAKTDLMEAFRLGLAQVMRFVLERGLPLHPQTLEVYNDLTLRRSAGTKDS